FALIVLAGMIHRVRAAFLPSERPGTRVVAHVGLAVVLAIVLVKSWVNFKLAGQDNPVLYDNAFGRLAARDVQRDPIRDLRDFLHVDATAPPRVFAYPTDAWIYLALPADNPTAFSLLRPVYNTPEQIQQAIDQVERDPNAMILLNVLFAKPGDPFVDYVNAHWHDVAGIGPRIILGRPLYPLYAPNANSWRRGAPPRRPL